METSARAPAGLGDQPLVSVITVSYQNRGCIAACLAALAAQDYPAYEVLVLDNASADGTADLVAQEFPWVRLLRAPRNRGFAAGNNAAAAAARGEVLVFLNPDTVPAPDFLTALVAMQTRYPDALVTAKITLAADPSALNTAGNDVHITGLTVCRGLGAAVATPRYDREAVVGGVSGAAFSMRRALFETLGGFQAAFFTYLEDTELSLRARLYGYECRYTPAAVTTHQYGAGFQPGKFFYLERNRYWMLLRIFRGPTLLRLAPSLLLSEVVIWGYALKGGPVYMGQKLRSYAWLLSHLGRLLRERRQVQHARRRDDTYILAPLVSDLEFTQLAGPRLGRLAGRTLNPFFRLNFRLVR